MKWEGHLTEDEEFEELRGVRGGAVVCEGRE